jgi:hypothetical protein
MKTNENKQERYMNKQKKAMTALLISGIILIPVGLLLQLLPGTNLNPWVGTLRETSLLIGAWFLAAGVAFKIKYAGVVGVLLGIILLSAGIYLGIHQIITDIGLGVIIGCIYFYLYCKFAKKKNIQPTGRLTAVAMIAILCTSFLSPVIRATALEVYTTQQATQQICLIKIGQITVSVEEINTQHYRVSYNGTTSYDVIIRNNNVTIVFNGTETFTVSRETNSTSSGEFGVPSSKSSSTSYLWDNVYFVEGQYCKYPHADRDIYGVSPYQDWSRFGEKLDHIQINHDGSVLLSKAGIAAIGAVLGALIGSFAGPYGTILGAIAGAIITTIITGVFLVMTDEKDCIWWWTSQAFLQWIAANAYWVAALYIFSLPICY